MFGGLLNNASNQISVVEALISTHKDFIDTLTGDRRTGVKVYAVSSCVTRLYAIYEHFVQSIISDYLDAIPELRTYAELSDGLKSEYRIGISHVLSKIGGDRYAHLTHENVILWYHEALTNEVSYRFVTDALTRHEQNLRLNVIENMLSRIELRDLRAWLTHCAEINNLYEEKSSICEQLEAELREFIQLRNDAAHGVFESLEGIDNLIRYCELIKSILKSLASFFHKSLLLARVEAGKSKLIGIAAEVLPRANAFIVQVGNGTRLAQGNSIHLVGAHYCYKQKIESLQVNSLNVTEIISPNDSFEIGVKCECIPHRNAQIYIDI